MQQGSIPWSRTLLTLTSMIIVCVVLYVSMFGVFNDSWLRVRMLMVAAVITTLVHVEIDGRPLNVAVLTGMLALLAFGVFAYFRSTAEIETGLYLLTTMDKLAGAAAVIAVIEFTRRTVGGVMAAITAAAFVYALFGQYAPGFLRHAFISVEEVMLVLWFSFDGVFGAPMATVVSTILIYILFGALLEFLRIDRTLIKVAIAATGRLKSGPANAAVLASGLFGTISGSAVANVAGTGVITIPMIKKRGFSPRFAGAVEAASSSGGQIMPPIMGAVAFIMADITGVPYLSIVIAAAIPALLYFGALFVAISFATDRMEVADVERPKLSFDWREMAQVAVFVVSLAAIVVSMVSGTSAAYAGLMGVVVAFVLGSALRPGLLTDLAAWRQFFVATGMVAAQLIVIVAAVGVVVGVLNMTGVGLRFAAGIAVYAETSLPIALILMAVACLLLGMGMPTVPAYLIVVLVMGTALAKLGVPTVHTHLFVLYFGVLSAVTPPVALAAFAAAPIAGARAMATAFEATGLALPGFLIPFAFVYQPALLLGTGHPMLESLADIVFVSVAMILLARACYPRRGHWPMAVVGVALSGGLIFFGPVVSVICLLAAAALLVFDRRRALNPIENA
ncbi:TRAP transporter permease [Jannaschia rubra]|uniref:TRAP transporter permease n=1 Tax=Jannaschia rubra TaxID=282197 RepID=UPI0024929721|nr:TRAP transporter fused permease subunit [Jannaschia rubra]